MAPHRPRVVLTGGQRASAQGLRVQWPADRAALAAAARGGRLGHDQHRLGKAELAQLIADLHLVEVTDGLVTEAADLAESEGLPGYDAVHLAAAQLLGASVFGSADRVLCDIATRRGLHVANPRTT